MNAQEKKMSLLLRRILIIGLAGAVLSCQRTQFQDTSSPSIFKTENPVVEPPVTPVQPEPPVPGPQAKVSSGTCANDSSTILTSCQKCLVPPVPPAPPQLSSKGKSLIDIMTLGCSVPNKSAPKDYVPPTREQILTRLNRLSPTLYPDSPMSASQVHVVEELKVNPAMQKHLFGKRWYTPPLSNHFETYFGLSIAEAVYQICYQSQDSIFTPDNDSPLQSIEFINCTYNSDPFGCRDHPEYIEGNLYRRQLRTAMRKSIEEPFRPQPTGPAQKTCRWEKYDGPFDLGGASAVARWLKKGALVSADVFDEAPYCKRIKDLSEAENLKGRNVLLASYSCQ
jgi:hypothetical protein